MHAILSFSSPRCAIIARLNVIYTEFRRAMIAQLNKIWHVWACVCVCDHMPLMAMPVTTSVAIMQVLRFNCNYAGGTFYYSYVGGSFCCNYAGDCLCCN